MEDSLLCLKGCQVPLLWVLMGFRVAQRASASLSERLANELLMLQFNDFRDTIAATLRWGASLEPRSSKLAEHHRGSQPILSQALWTETIPRRDQLSSLLETSLSLLEMVG